MRKELSYFRIEDSYGGCQDWFPDQMMRLGGCAAVTACDCCIYFDFYKGTHLYPYNINCLTKEDYIRFGMRMEPYLKPRWTGIDRLDIYIEGFQQYLTDHQCFERQMTALDGNEPVEEARKAVIRQIRCGVPVPCLILNHKNPNFEWFEWHWFLLTGYETFEEECMVKAVTYGNWYWLNLKELWDTGCSRKGGLILF